MKNRLPTLLKITMLLFCWSMVHQAQAQVTVLETFDAFCELFDKNYASFDEKGIEWDEGCKTARTQLNKESSEDDLFRVMTELLKPLNDGHVSLRAKSLEAGFSASRPSRIMDEINSIPSTERRPRFRTMTEKTLVDNGFSPIKEIGQKYKDEKLFSYSKSQNIGYLRYIRSFSNIVNMTGGNLNQHLDEIFSAFEGLDAIIIDIRFNIGGDDSFSQRIAGYLVNEPTVGFHKQTRVNREFKELKTHMIKPSKKHHFRGKVVLLTNDKTVSAADVMALMLSEMPQVTIIGEPSNGSYSDLQNKRLPNGWKITLSNQRYLSPIKKKNYEGFGTPVDIEVKNMLSDIERQEDSVLSKALEFLKRD